MNKSPSYDVDLYADEAIENPYDHYVTIRQHGPAVWLPRHNMWAIGRFADVRKALKDYATFSSAQGVAANDKINTASLGNTVTSDPPEHSQMRNVIREPLTIPALETVAPRIEAEAEALVDRLVFKRTFDVMEDCARYLPVTIVSELVGLPEEGRANMLRWAAATFDALGVMNGRAQAALPQIQELHAFCSSPTTIDRLKPDGWAAGIWRAADAGKIPRSKCPAMLRDYVSPSLDTTIFATGNLIWLLGRNPEQWNMVRDDPNLIQAAINEALRLESPVRGFTRVAAKEAEIDGFRISSGQRVLMLYASANRDERKWKDPDVFDVRRNAHDHLGFGFGVHMCVGMHLARLEMTALLKAFASRVTRFEVGPPVRAVNNVLRGFAQLPVRIH